MRSLLGSPTFVLLWRSAALKRRRAAASLAVLLSPVANPLLVMALLAALPSRVVQTAAALAATLHQTAPFFAPPTFAAAPALVPDQVAILARIVLSVYLVLGFSAHSQAALVEMVVEKEKKIKEGLLMQGLGPSAFWASVHLVYTIYAAVVCTLITWIISPLFPLSNPFLIFLLLFLLDLANISSTLSFAPFFNTSKAALLFDSFINILLFTIPIILIFWLEWAPSELAIIFISLIFYPLGFFFGMLRVNQLEMEGVGANWSNSLDGRGIGGFLIVLAVDCILYMGIALYLDQVIPQDFGVPRPWWFPLKFIHRKTYEVWIETSQPRNSPSESLLSVSDDIEPDPTSMRMLVNLQNLVMKFPKSETNAVDGFSVKLFEDEIFALLGHNGAGKSTVLHILTGLISATSGLGTVAGYDLTNEMTSIRRHIGVCPQYDIQHEDLTVAEHILLFAGIKGMWVTKTRSELDLVVTEVLTLLDLEAKRDEFVKVLSGGQKRKLSVAMAIVGNPKILILDEPTAGMDPVSRRSLWAMLTSNKKGRLTFLTTHMMDEADLVADRKAILSKGRLRCLGTSVFLKHRFNVGYHLSIAYQRASMSDLKVTSVINKYVPGATVVSQSSSTAPRYGSTTTMTPMSPTISSSSNGRSSSSEGENLMIFSVPPSFVSNFPRLFNALDKHSKNGGILYYGLSMPSLEEVFLRSDGGGLETNEEARLAEEHWARVSANEVVDEEALLLGNDNVLHATPMFAQLISLVHARWIMFGRSLSSTIPGILFPLYMFYPIFSEDISSATSSFWVITMSLLLTAVSCARETVQERFQKIDTFLKSVGVSSAMYWGTNLIAHYPLMASPGLIMCWLVAFWDVKAFGGAAFWMFFLTNIIFSKLALISSYVIGRLFNEPGAFLSSSTLFILFGTSLPYSFLMYFETMGDPFYASLSHTIASFVLPTYPYSAILYLMARAYTKAQQHEIPPLTPGYYFSWENKMLPSLLGMLVQCGIFMCLLLWLDGFFLPAERTVLNAEEIAEPVDRRSGGDDSNEDANVKRERERVVNPLSTEDVLLRRVRKVFPENEKNWNGGFSLWGWVSKYVVGGKNEDKDLVAVRDLSLTCSQGEVLAILGPNGAGKTTAMSMAVGDQLPTRGVVAITTLEDQYPPQSPMARVSLFGQVAQHDTLWPLLTAREHLNLFASLKGIVQKRRGYWIRMLVDALGSNLSDDLDKKCKELSGGTKRKVAFLVALVGKPKILFLDEPTTGIDPKAKRNLWNLLKALQGRLATILTTHSLEEADSLASRIGIMVKGELVCLGTQQYIKTMYGKGYLLEVHTQSGDPSTVEVTRIIEENLPHAVLKEKFEDIMTRWEVPEEDVVNLGGLGKVFELFERVKTSGAGGLKEFCFGQMSLEMVFLNLVKRESGGDDIELVVDV
ncbi:P-loop containing nucleoside triphosphate hydrolase protein [Obelidium mucronatum]|nr:P-loop containing nucleoside triphosphate hydrolase protein [Obelidium mucronatum]